MEGSPSFLVLFVTPFPKILANLVSELIAVVPIPAIASDPSSKATAVV